VVVPIEERLKFFVFIIESPSAVDLYHGRTEGEMIRQAVGLNAIRSASKIAVNSEAFEAAIRIGLREEMEANPGLVPVLHISSKPTWPETAVAFATLYHLLANGHYIGDAVDAMRIASGNKRFLYDTAEGVKKGYLEYLSSVDVESAVEELKEEGDRAENEGELTKLIREDSGAAR
jgi:hypothetical protein